MVLHGNEAGALCNKKMVKSAISISLLVLVALKSWASPLDRYEFSKENLFVPGKLGELQLFHENNQFTVMKEGVAPTVQNCFVDKEIRNVPTEKLVRFLGLAKDLNLNGKQCLLLKAAKCAAEQDQASYPLTEQQGKEIAMLLSASDYLAVNRLSDGEYSIQVKHRLPGGGTIGATIGMFAGKFVVYAAWGTSVVVVGGAATLVGGPVAGKIVAESYAASTVGVAEALSVNAAVAGGIAGGVATGPV